MTDTDTDLYESFYSTTLGTKIKRLTALAENCDTIALTELSEAICDGCGGCEQIMYGDIHGLSQGELISVLFSGSNTVWYVHVRTDSHSNVEMIRVARVFDDQLPEGSEDSLHAYLAVLALTDEWTILDGDR